MQDSKKSHEAGSQSCVEAMSRVSVPAENNVPDAAQHPQPPPPAGHDSQVKRGNENKVDVVREVEDSKRRKIEPEKRDVSNSRRHNADASVKTSVPPREEIQNSNSKEERKSRVSNRTEHSSSSRRDSRRSSHTRAISPVPNKHNTKSNYHRGRRKSPECRPRSRSRSPHPRSNRTRSNRHVPY